jgi:hypothetical protein
VESGYFRIVDDPTAIAQIGITGDIHTNEQTARLHRSAFAQTEKTN